MVQQVRNEEHGPGEHADNAAEVHENERCKHNNHDGGTIVAATGGNQNNVGSFSFPGNVPFKVPAKSMVRLAAKAPAAVAVTAGFSMSVQGSGSGTTVTES